MSTLQDLLLKSPGLVHQRVAVALPETKLNDVKKIAAELQSSNVSLGKTVAIVLPNGYPVIAIFLAVTWTRAVAAPLNAAYTVEEFSFYLADIKADLVILMPGPHAARDAAAKLNLLTRDVLFDEKTGAISLSGAAATPAVAKESAPQPDDVALFLHTSGTTSRPKLVPLTHANLTVSARNIADGYELRPEDSTLIVMPLFHVHGLVGATLSTLLSGGTVVVPSRFSATAFWPAVSAYNVTWYTAVPTIHQILLARADQDQALSGKFRFIRSCSSALAPATLSQLESRFGAPVLEAYGMTEATHQMASNPLPSKGKHLPGSVGLGTNVEIAILDDNGQQVPNGSLGEVCIKGKNVTKGYWNNPEANAANWTKDGWFRTGDQGFLDADGYLLLTGRLKELINRGGEKISPLEVDAVLLEHPGVAEAVCFAVKDEKYGEEIQAAVVPRQPNAVTEQDLVAFAKGRVSAFKVPKKIYITDALPRTATGKIQRRFVAQHFTGGAERKAPATSVWLVVELWVKPDVADALKPILEELITKSRAEKGCKQYDMVVAQDDPHHLLLVEEWADAAALAAHDAAEHKTRLAPRLGEFVSKPISLRKFAPYMTK